MATTKKLTPQQLTILQGAIRDGVSFDSLAAQFGVDVAALNVMQDSMLNLPGVASPTPGRVVDNTPGWTVSGRPSVWQVDTGVGLFGSPTNPDMRLQQQSLLGAADQGLSANGPDSGIGEIDTVDSYGSMGRYIPPPVVGDRTQQSPQLRQMRRTMRKENDKNWRGTTDTILTSSRGVKGAANTMNRTLLGA